MKKLFALMLSTLFMLNSISIANAADPQVLFEVDCVGVNRALQVGFQSDPADPANGPEIIAFGFTFELAPIGSTSINDLSAATLEVNPEQTNVVIAKNTSETVGNTQVIIVEGGFTGQQGLNDVNDLFLIKGTNQKSYTITVKDGELIPENSLDNIFVNTPEQSFNVDPSTCDEAATAGTTIEIDIKDLKFDPALQTITKGTRITWTNSDQVAHTVTSKDNVGPLDSGTIDAGETFSFTCSPPPAELLSAVISMLVSSVTALGVPGAAASCTIMVAVMKG